MEVTEKSVALGFRQCSMKKKIYFCPPAVLYGNVKEDIKRTCRPRKTPSEPYSPDACLTAGDITGMVALTCPTPFLKSIKPDRTGCTVVKVCSPTASAGAGCGSKFNTTCN